MGSRFRRPLIHVEPWLRGGAERSGFTPKAGTCFTSVGVYLLGKASNSRCSSALRHRQGHQCHHRRHLPEQGSDRPWVGWGEKVPFLALKRVNKEKKAKRKKSEGFITQLAP